MPFRINSAYSPKTLSWTRVTLITRQYNAAAGGGGVDARFNYNPSTNFYWTAWQTESLAIPTSGHDYRLSILASDCQPTGHAGYLYLDGFGNVAPPAGAAPEPTTLGLMAFGIGGLIAAKRKLRKA